MRGAERAEKVGVRRRTIVKGAAWSIPAIAAATALPSAVASGLELAFNQAQYTGTACGTLTGVTVTATNGTAPAPNTPVTVVLSDGYTFADGTTTFTGTTDSAGKVSLPAIKVPAGGGNTTLSASSGAASATAAVSTPVVNSTFGYVQDATLNRVAAIPAGSKPAYGGNFLTPDGRLVGPQGQTLASNVSEIGQAVSNGTDTFTPIKFANGTFGYLQNGTLNTASAIPAGSKPAFGGNFLTPDGRLVDAQGRTIASNVKSVGQAVTAGGDTFTPIEFADGTFGYLQNRTLNTASAIPAGSKPAFGGNFLTPDGRLVDAQGRTIASNVKSVGQAVTTGSNTFTPIEFADGTFGYLQNRTLNTAPAVPAGSTPAYGGNFLTPDGRLVDAQGRTIASNVKSIGQAVATNTSTYTPVELAPSC